MRQCLHLSIVVPARMSLADIGPSGFCGPGIPAYVVITCQAAHKALVGFACILATSQRRWGGPQFSAVQKSWPWIRTLETVSTPLTVDRWAKSRSEAPEPRTQWLGAEPGPLKQHGYRICCRGLKQTLNQRRNAAPPGVLGFSSLPVKLACIFCPALKTH